MAALQFVLVAVLLGIDSVKDTRFVKTVVKNFGRSQNEKTTVLL